MIEEALRKIDNLIKEELNEYNSLSGLYDEKKQVLIKSKTDNLIDIDNKIKEKVLSIKNIETKRKNIDNELGLSNACMSDYIELANKNSLNIEKNLLSKKSELIQMNFKIANKEKINTELIKQGMAVVSKLINIIVNGAGISGQYNNSGKNIQDDCIKISSFTEEV